MPVSNDLSRRSATPAPASTPSATSTGTATVAAPATPIASPSASNTDALMRPQQSGSGTSFVLAKPPGSVGALGPSAGRPSNSFSASSIGGNSAPQCPTGIPATLGTDAVTIPKSPPAPAEFAATVERLNFLNDLDASGGTDPRFHAVELLTAQLGQHKGDTAYARALFQSMGSKLTADLLAAAGNPLSYTDPTSGKQPLTADEIRGRIQTVQDTLVGLSKSGALNSGDMQRLAEQWSTGSKEPEHLVEIFGRMPPGGEALQGMFVTSASKAVQNKSSSSADNLAGAAATVLSNATDDQAMSGLGGLQKNGELAAFIGKAMSAKTELLSPLAMSREARSGYDPNPPAQTTKSEGVAGLLSTLSLADVRDPRQGTAPLTSSELTAVRTDAFSGAIKAFGQGQHNGDPAVKDALSRMYVTDFNSLNAAILSNNQAAYKDSAFGKGMTEFFQHALFKPPLGGESGNLMKFVTGQFSDLSKSLSVDAIGNQGPIQKEQLLNAHKLGLLQGTMMNGLQQSKDEIGKSAEAWSNALEFVLTSSLSLIPGAGKFVGELGEPLIDEIFDQLTDMAKDKIKAMTVDQAKQYLISTGEGALDYSTLAETLHKQAAQNVLQYGDWGQAYDDALKLQ